jgi:hypothetical protein
MKVYRARIWKSAITSTRCEAHSSPLFILRHIYASFHLLIVQHIHPEEGNYKVCRNVVTASTYHAAKPRKLTDFVAQNMHQQRHRSSSSFRMFPPIFTVKLNNQLFRTFHCFSYPLTTKKSDYRSLFLNAAFHQWDSHLKRIGVTYMDRRVGCISHNHIRNYFRDITFGII